MPRGLLLVIAAWLVLSAGVSRAAERPNILFIIFDDLSWNHIGAYGCDWINTPNLDRVAGEGVRFTNAFTSNPKCSPCRASILTGRNSWQLEEASCHFGVFPRKFAVYPELLEAAGYTIGLTGKGWGPGDFKSTGFKHNPAGPSFNTAKASPPTRSINTNDYAGNFEEFLKQCPPDKPFCFWIGFSEPHRGYEKGSGVRLGKKLQDVQVPPYLPDTPEVRGDLADYAVEVEYADTHIGRALAALEASGRLEDTLVIVTSDHGMPFPYVKGQIHEDGYRLPLVMRWGQRIKPGRVVDDFVNVRDLAPTYLGLAGLEAHEQMTGKSLANILTSKASGWIEKRDVMLIGKERHDLGRPNDAGYPVRAIRTPEYLYVHNFFPDRWPAGDPQTGYANSDDGPTEDEVLRLGGYYYDLSFGKRPADELYRLKDDPQTVRNLANDLAFHDTMNDLRARMMQMLKSEQDPRALGKGAVFDTYQYTGPRRHAYDNWLRSQSPNAQDENR